MKKYMVVRICKDDTSKPVAYAAPSSGRGHLCDTLESALDVKGLYERMDGPGYSIFRIEV